MNADNRDQFGAGQPNPNEAADARAAVVPPSGTMPQRTAFRVPGAAQPSGQTAPQAGSAQAPASRPNVFAPVDPASRQGQGTSLPTADRLGPTRVGQPTGAPGAGLPTTGQTGAGAGTFTPGPGAPSSVQAAGAPARVATGAAPTRVSTGAVVAGSASAPKAEVDAAAKPKPKGGPRTAKVMVASISPLSALKIGFLLSIALGIAQVVATHVLWQFVNTNGVIDLIQKWVSQLFGKDEQVNILQFIDYEKVMSATMLVSVSNVVILSLLALISALIYNMISKVVGGVYVTLTDD